MDGKQSDDRRSDDRSAVDKLAGTSPGVIDFLTVRLSAQAHYGRSLHNNDRTAFTVDCPLLQ